MSVEHNEQEDKGAAQLVRVGRQDEPAGASPSPRYGDYLAGRGGGRGGGPTGQPDPTDIRQLLGVLRRHKYLIVGLTLFVTVCAALYTSELTSLYRADAQLVLEQKQANVVPMEDLVRGAPIDWQTARTESAVIASRELAKRAVEQLELKKSPLFNPNLRRAPGEPGPVDRLRHLIGMAKQDLRAWLVDLGVLGESEPRAPIEYADRDGPAWSLPDTGEDPETAYYVSAYLSGLHVDSDDNSRIITISYVSTNPDFAAAAANTSARVYIDNQRQEKGDVANQAQEWLNKSVASAKQDLISAERELESYRERVGITDIGRGQSLETEQLARLNAQLSDARARLAEARARYQQVRELLKNEGQIESAAAVLDSDLIENLRLDEVKLQRRIAELNSQYREDHPKMKYAHAELEDLRTRIRDEVNKIAANLRNEVEVAQARVNNLQAEVDEQHREVNELGDAQATFRALRSEVEANRQLYETLLDRFKEVSVQDNRSQEADAQMINPAVTPGAPFYPNRKMIVVAAFVVSAVCAVALAFLLDLLDSGYRGLRQLEDGTGVPALGMVPRIKLRRHEMPHSVLALKRGSYFGEAIRMLRTGVTTQVRREGGARVLLVTSSVPSEGKTTTALSIAAQDTHAKRHSIVVDCDLRVANLGRYLEQADRVGLGNYLQGEAELRDIIAQDPQSGLHFITAGTPVDHPDELLGSDRMAKLIGALAQEYTRVVLDTPPVLAVADTIVLLPRADAVLYAVHWGDTKRELVEAGLKRLWEAESPPVLTALTLVDLKQQAQYSYAESYYGYGAYYAAQ